MAGLACHPHALRRAHRRRRATSPPTGWRCSSLVGTLALVYRPAPLAARPGARRDPRLASPPPSSLGVDAFRTKLVVYVLAAFGTGMIGALIYLQKARISPDAAFSVLDWTAYVIFIVVIGGIGTIEGPIIGAVVLFLLQDYLAALRPLVPDDARRPCGRSSCSSPRAASGDLSRSASTCRFSRCGGG